MKVRNDMDKDRFFDRIDKIEDIGILSKQVCKEYNLGDYIDTSIVEIGYEDFNAIISTKTGKYFMKIFRNSRDNEEVREVIERAYVAEQSGVRSPKVLKNSNEKIITNINYNNSNFRLAIMEYIEGSNFFQIEGKKQESEKRIKDMFERWANNVGATDFERNAFQLLFRVQNAIDILNPSYEIAIGNNSEENKMYLELGNFGLTLNVDMSKEIERVFCD